MSGHPRWIRHLTPKHVSWLNHDHPADSGHLSRAHEQVVSHRHGMMKRWGKTHAPRPFLVLAVAAAPLAGLSLGLAHCGGESSLGAPTDRYAADASVSGS